MAVPLRILFFCTKSKVEIFDSLDCMTAQLPEMSHFAHERFGTAAAFGAEADATLAGIPTIDVTPHAIRTSNTDS
jgi:hypothetical protein